MRQNQKKNTYRIFARCNCHENGIGTSTILPSSVMGSPRQMMQQYQDSMSIVRKFGKPDLFITFTCNPNWNKIHIRYGTPSIT